MERDRPIHTSYVCPLLLINKEYMSLLLLLVTCRGRRGLGALKQGPPSHPQWTGAPMQGDSWGLSAASRSPFFSGVFCALIAY